MVSTKERATRRVQLDANKEIVNFLSTKCNLTINKDIDFVKNEMK